MTEHLPPDAPTTSVPSFTRPLKDEHTLHLAYYTNPKMQNWCSSTKLTKVKHYPWNLRSWAQTSLSSGNLCQVFCQQWQKGWLISTHQLLKSDNLSQQWKNLTNSPEETKQEQYSFQASGRTMSTNVYQKLTFCPRPTTINARFKSPYLGNLRIRLQ